MLVAGINKCDIRTLKAQLARKFYVKDLGAIKHMFRMTIQRDKKNKKV